jgi:hypothetical protein
VVYNVPRTNTTRHVLAASTTDHGQRSLAVSTMAEHSKLRRSSALPKKGDAQTSAYFGELRFGDQVGASTAIANVKNLEQCKHQLFTSISTENK